MFEFFELLYCLSGLSMFYMPRINYKIAFWLLLITLISFSMYSYLSREKCDITMCKYKVGQQIKIKNKAFNDDAIIKEINCGCIYSVNYYNFLGKKTEELSEYEIRTTNIFGF